MGVPYYSRELLAGDVVCIRSAILELKGGDHPPASSSTRAHRAHERRRPQG